MSSVGHIQRGVLLTCDAALKQFIIHLDRKHKFIIADFDETHLFVDAACGVETLIQDGLEELNKENTFEAGSDEKQRKRKR